jgi:hypothetical protein
MGRFRKFQTAARECGFVELKSSGDGSVLWFGKNTSQPDKQPDQRLCIDRLTNSATVYFTTPRGTVDSKTFRAVSNLQEWIASEPSRGQDVKPSGSSFSLLKTSR